MYKKVKCLLFLFLFFNGALQAQEVKFAGTADKKFDGNKIIIYNRAVGVHDSAYIKDGKFSFTLPFKEPTRYMFYSDFEKTTKGGYGPWGVMVTEPGTVSIAGDIESFSQSKVTGAKENALYNDYTAKSGQAQKEIIDQLTTKYGKELINNRNPDTADIRYKQLMQEYKAMSEASQKLESARLKKFVKENPASFSAISLLDANVNRMELAEVEAMFASLSPKYKDTRSGKSISKGIEARKITALGKTAPEFAQPDTLGKLVKLSDFRGKYVLIDFWASWCGPCRAENPNLVKTFNHFKDKGFTVLGVSLDQPGKKEAWLGAIRKDGLDWTQVSDLKFWENDVAVLYGIKGIPASLLLDKDGKIIAKDLRGADLDKKLAEVLGN